MKVWQNLFKGIIRENPVLVLLLGTCPTLAVTTSVSNAFGMGLAAMAVLIGSNFAISLLRNVIPDKVEAAEFIIREKSPVANKMLMDLKFKKDVLVAAILRGNDVITPRGQDVIQAGDAVVVVSKRLGMRDITDILK